MVNIKLVKTVNVLILFLNTERVSPQKKLRGGVIFISEIPKNPSGKILRRELHKLLKKRLPSKH
jgi:4-coumarate--CoA ligase